MKSTQSITSLTFLSNMQDLGLMWEHQTHQMRGFWWNSWPIFFKSVQGPNARERLMTVLGDRTWLRTGSFTWKGHY